MLGLPPYHHRGSMDIDTPCWTIRGLEVMPDDGGWKRHEITEGELFDDLNIIGILDDRECPHSPPELWRGFSRRPKHNSNNVAPPTDALPP